ncbi:hypothetical protein C8J55DRAFT_606944 [Lentinula edodes]|uniref:Uncharacterized protein n=1 Tax=Lentinula lateritia TaxID=40482 RepID=A0A9W9DLT8_9AGAR|nr:hypothetical protein C8J55DRAFT_606944 [Lentinula edodes]
MAEPVHHTPSDRDVQIVRYLFQTLLPLELVDVIIEDAEYWPCIHVDRSEPILVDAKRSISRGLKMAWCYLVSSPVPEALDSAGQSLGQSRVRRVDLKVQGHDQGWATHPGPWSWFEATIIPALSESNLVWLPAALKGPVDPASVFAGSNFDETFEGFTRWHIAANAIATQVKQDHSIVWTEQEAQAPGNIKGMRGREGLGHELVRALQPGDRIAILALAEQWGWENHVYNASIDIEGDVRIVRNLLRTFLPLELVDVIIADAEYWLCIHVERSKQIRVDARIALGQGFKLAWCYLVSPPIPLSSVGQGLGQRRVRKVQLKVQATNLSPSSWYEATIIKASRQPGLLWLPAALRGPVDPASHLARPHFDQVFAGFTRWHIASNELGNRTKQDHSVIWTEEEVQGPRDAGSIKGREGFGHELVRALQPGDRIAILALAQQWGWENHVYSASITIQYSV